MPLFLFKIKIMDFTIDRNTWRCGGDMPSFSLNPDNRKGSGDVMLLNSQGFMCCLGHVGLQCGLTTDDIEDVAEPNELFTGHSGQPETEEFDAMLIKTGVLSKPDGHNSELSADAIDINDNGDIDLATRETQLIKLFFEHGHGLEFTGTCVEYTGKPI